jgi:hypothetical protein
LLGPQAQQELKDRKVSLVFPILELLAVVVSQVQLEPLATQVRRAQRDRVSRDQEALQDLVVPWDNVDLLVQMVLLEILETLDNLDLPVTLDPPVHVVILDQLDLRANRVPPDLPATRETPELRVQPV